MSTDIDWRNLVPRVMNLGPSARRAPEFDAQARARAVEKEVEALKGAAYWLTSLAGRRKQVRELRQRLAAETARLAREAELEAERLRDAVVRADKGEPDALAAILQRWMELRPEALAPLHLEIRQLSGEQGEGEWLLEGRAVGRADIERSMERMRGTAGVTDNGQRATRRSTQGAPPGSAASSAPGSSVQDSVKERLEGGDMSTGDLMKVITMSAPEPEPVKAAAGDWVLDLQEDV